MINPLHRLRFVLAILVLVVPTSGFAQSKNFLSFGMQFPWRWIPHEGTYSAVSHFDSFSEGTRSWDGSIGHYFEVGRYFGADRGFRESRCGVKLRGDFDYRSDHDVEYESSTSSGSSQHESELDLSIFSLMPMAECQRNFDENWGAFVEVGGGLAVHVNGVKYVSPATPDPAVTVPTYFDGREDFAEVDVDYEPGFAIGTGLVRQITDSSSIRTGLQYRYMGENHIYEKHIHEAAMSFGIRVGF